MNRRRQNFFLIAFVIAGVAIANGPVLAKENVSMAEFVKMSHQERVEVCARLVSSEQIGQCASMHQPTGEALTVADIKKIIGSCFNSDEEMDPMDMAKCIRTKLDAKGVPAEYPCLKDIARAYEICTTTVNDSEDIGSCTAGLCTRLEVE